MVHLSASQKAGILPSLVPEYDKLLFEAKISPGGDCPVKASSRPVPTALTGGCGIRQVAHTVPFRRGLCLINA